MFLSPPTFSDFYFKSSSNKNLPRHCPFKHLLKSIASLREDKSMGLGMTKARPKRQEFGEAAGIWGRQKHGQPSSPPHRSPYTTASSSSNRTLHLHQTTATPPSSSLPCISIRPPPTSSWPHCTVSPCRLPHRHLHCAVTWIQYPFFVYGNISIHYPSLLVSIYMFDLGFNFHRIEFSSSGGSREWWLWQLLIFPAIGFGGGASGWSWEWWWLRLF